MTRKMRSMKKSATKKPSAKKTARKGTPWTQFVKKIYAELKKKDKNASLGDAMKEASKRKKEMK
jgi:hypothetical protein